MLLQRLLVERRARWEADQLAQMKAAGRPPKDDRWKQRYAEPTPPETEGLPELPITWVWATFEMVGDVQGGIQKQPSRKPRENSYSYLSVRNVMRNSIDLLELHKIELFGAEFERLKLEYHDLLIVEGNGSKSEIGRSALWRNEVPNCVHQNHIIRVRFPRISSKYINFFVNSPIGVSSMMNLAYTTSGLYTLSVSKVKSTAFPMPSLSEQNRIVAEIEQRISVLQETETSLATNLLRAERLREMLLQQAFSGRLVAQEPAPESAAALLERIRAVKQERAAQQKANPRPRGTKMSSPHSARVRRPLYDVLVEAGSPLTPEDLFTQAGFDPKADEFADAIEEFYRELRDETRPGGRIDEQRLDKAKVFLKVRAHAD